MGEGPLRNRACDQIGLVRRRPRETGWHGARQPGTRQAFPLAISGCLALRRRLRRIADRAVACCGTGLRRERVHAQRPEGPALSGQRPPMPARALSAQVQLAHPVDPVRRAGRGSAPITGLIHLRPPSGPPPGPGARPAVPYGLLATFRVLSRPGRIAAVGCHRPVRSWFAWRGSRSSCLSGRPAAMRCPGGDGGHVMALFPAWHAGARFARPGNPAAAGSLAGRQVPARAACVLTDKG